jgi:hypothetical protein
MPSAARLEVTPVVSGGIMYVTNGSECTYQFDSLELTERGIRPSTRSPLSHAELDEHKRNLAAAVVARFSANHIRAQNRLRQSPPYVGLLPPHEIERLNEQAAGCSSCVEWLNAIGQDSPFHREHGYYADPLESAEAGDRERLISLLGEASLDLATRERVRVELERGLGVRTEA